MYGALLGDMIGAPYEFDRGNKAKEFPLFCEYSHFTDDSVMTIAVAEALLDYQFWEDEDIKAGLIECMRKWGKKYPNAGFMPGIPNPTAATATDRPCVSHPRGGCLTHWRRPGTWRV